MNRIPISNTKNTTFRGLLFDRDHYVFILRQQEKKTKQGFELLQIYA